MDTRQEPVVAVCRCSSYDSAEVKRAVSRQFDLLGGIDRFIEPGQRVLIKPNLIVPRSSEVPAQTHPEVVYAIADCVKNAGAIPLVGDSPAWSDTQSCLKVLGILPRLKELGVEVVSLDQPVRMNIEGVNLGISRVALDADVIINVPKLKAHQQLGATFAFKNMYGCVCGLAGKEKAYWHFARGKVVEDFCRMIVGIYSRLKPVLNIIDGIVAMEGQGPISGDPRKIGYLIAGDDATACERICCQMVDFDPADLPLMIAAEKMGLGCGLHSSIETVGDTFTCPVCPDFKPAIQTPLRFTFPHICKSIAKQSFILMKGLFS